MHQLFQGVHHYSLGKQQHKKQLRTVLETLPKERLYAKFSKGKIWLNQVAFLVHIVTTDGIEVDLAKVEVVLNWKATTNVNEIRNFLGLAGYYKRFIQKLFQNCQTINSVDKEK